jgi:serine protease Do
VRWGFAMLRLARVGTVWCVVAAGACLLAPALARADFQSSEVWFGQKDEKDRVLLQGMLILLGHYAGLIDGVFGQRTYDAIVGYQTANGLTADGVLSDVEETEMVVEATAVYQALEFSDEEDAEAGIRIPIAKKLFTESSPSRWGRHWQNDDGSIELETLAIATSETPFQTLFDRLRLTSDRTVEYSLLRESFFVLSGNVGDKKFYTSFVRFEDTSRGFSIAWDRSRDELGSVLSLYIASMVQYADTAGAVALNDPLDADGKEAVPEDDGPIGQSSGSGFAVSTKGVIVTNAHVVEGCGEVMVVGLGPAEVETVDDEIDLALLRVANATFDDVAQLQLRPLELGQSIVVLGYPLSELMGNALTVNQGIVSSLSGIGGDPTQFTVSANIQPGNSGGPILDMGGRVVGIAAAKFDEAKMLAAAGTTAANIGFAVDSQSLAGFLSRLETSTVDELPASDATVQQAVARARDYTYQIVCDAPTIAANPLESRAH